MARTLRPRKSQVNYAVLAGRSTSSSGDDGDGATSPTAPPIIDRSSGSDFALDEGKDGEADDDDDEDGANVADDDDDMDVDDEPVAVKPTPKAKLAPKPRKAAAPPRPKVAGGTRQKMYVLPTPSVHHRHRAVPLFSPTNDVERLVSKPTTPFGQTSTTLTKGFTHDAKTTDRVNKAWGYNVGPGPAWELVEDRAWFKEAKDGAETEADRRPVVYSTVKTSTEFRVLTSTFVVLHFSVFP